MPTKTASEPQNVRVVEPCDIAEQRESGGRQRRLRVLHRSEESGERLATGVFESEKGIADGQEGWRML